MNTKVFLLILFLCVTYRYAYSQEKDIELPGVGILCDGGPLSVTPLLQWIPVTIPGITYNIQISNQPNMQSPIINVDYLTKPFYQVLVNEQLSTGTVYYWRVRVRLLNTFGIFSILCSFTTEL